MKKIIIALSVIFVSLSGFSQKQEEYKEPTLPVDQETKLITYTKVIDVTASQDSLFRKGKLWFHTFYKNPTGVIREENAADGKIMGKHQFKVSNPADKNGVETMKDIIQYTITTQYKEGKVRIIITEINRKATSYYAIEKWLDKTASDFTNKNYYYLEQINKFANETIADFEKFMKEPTKVKKDEW